MNTTTAATQAEVTVATVRDWARRGIIAATKQAGRWAIDSSSLARRIAIGKERRMTQPTYRIEEATVVRYGSERTVWRVVRVDGTPAGYGPGKDARIADAEFIRRDTAETYREFYERTPAGYRLTRDHYAARSMKSGKSYWLVSGSGKGDPGDLRHTWDDGTKVVGNWPEGTTWLDVLISIVTRHAEGAADRIARKAEKDAAEAAEQAARETRAARLAEARQQKGTLATPRQVDYILQLLARRERTGEGGGFFYGPTGREAIEEMSKADASTYITSLKGDY